MPDSGYQNIMALVNSLKQRGYKIKKTKAYTDAKNGILRIQDDGSINAIDVRAYELTLSLARDRQPSADILTAVETKAELEAEHIRLKNEKMRFDIERESGKYVLAENFFQEISERETVFMAGLEYLVATRVPYYLSLIGASETKRGILEEVLLDDLCGLANDLSTDQVFYTLDDREVKLILNDKKGNQHFQFLNKG